MTDEIVIYSSLTSERAHTKLQRKILNLISRQLYNQPYC